MNYTDSLDRVVHAATKQTMHTDSAAICTVQSAKDTNMVIWSLMEVVKSAGLAGLSFNPDDVATYSVVKKALETVYAKLNSPEFTGTPTAPTPAQFNSSQRLATTEAVQRALGSFNLGSNTGPGINAAATPLTNAHIGAYLYFNGGLNQTATLPSEAGLPPGSAVTFSRSVVPFTLTIKSNTGNAIVDSGLGLFPSIVLNSGEFVTLVWSGVTWQAVGSYVSRLAFANGSLLSANGYQKLPSGLIILLSSVERPQFVGQ